MRRFLAIVMLVGTSASVDAADKPVSGISVAGVGMASFDQKTIFLPAKGGGVEAVDIANGKQLWLNKDANVIAGASEKLVFAWIGDAKKANAFRVVAIDAATGKTSGKSDTITMADWATTGKEGGHLFRTATRTTGNDTIVAWEAGTRYFGGAPPSEEVLKAAQKDAGALVSVDFKTGKTKVLEQKPKEEDFSGSPSGQFNDKVGKYQFTGQLTPNPEKQVMHTTLIVLKDDKEVWKRELADTPWFPPPP